MMAILMVMTFADEIPRIQPQFFSKLIFFGGGLFFFLEVGKFFKKAPFTSDYV